MSYEIKDIVNSYWHIIQNDHQLTCVFSDPTMCSFSKGSNLPDKLVHADTFILPASAALTNAQGHFPCHKSRPCSRYFKCNSFTHPQTLKTYKIRQLITCKSSHVIYIITCPCRLMYVGKTRMIEHMSAIHRQDETSSVFTLEICWTLCFRSTPGSSEDFAT